jgi:peptidoglycan/LPS O-acetylase OafA/YrhL
MVIAAVATYCAAAPIWLQGVLSFALAVLIAYLMNKVLEAPFARIRKKLSAG